MNEFSFNPGVDEDAQAAAAVFDDRLPEGDDYGEDYDVEALWNSPLDHEADEAAVKELMLPAGTYAPTTLTAKRFTSDYTGKVRRVISLSGKVEKGQVKGGLRFKISPDRAHKKDDPTKLSWDYVLYVQAKQAYIKFYKLTTEDAVRGITLDDLQTFLMDGHAQYRVIQGDTDNVVVGIQAGKS
jgi:hypothetical protein